VQLLAEQLQLSSAQTYGTVSLQVPPALQVELPVEGIDAATGSARRGVGAAAACATVAALARVAVVAVRARRACGLVVRQAGAGRVAGVGLVQSSSVALPHNVPSGSWPSPGHAAARQGNSRPRHNRSAQRRGIPPWRP